MAKTATYLIGIALIVSLGLVLSGTGPMPAQVSAHHVDPPPPPPPTGDRGCTPGFWKNHPEAWPGSFSPSQSVGSVFSGASAFPSLASASLLDALAFRGGSGAEGAARILLRAAVAALLNSATFGASYPFSSVVSTTNAALTGGNRSAMLSLATDFDVANNLGCPL